MNVTSFDEIIPASFKRWLNLLDDKQEVQIQSSVLQPDTEIEARQLVSRKDLLP